MHRHAIAYTMGTAALGLLGLIIGDSPLQWQPAPENVPGRSAFAYATSIILLAGAALILTRSHAIKGAVALAVLYGLYVLLHVPDVIAAPLEVVPWLGLAEILAPATGGVMLALTLAGHDRVAAKKVTLLAFSFCPLIYGISHFAYLDFTASMVPGWIPAPLFWASATGAAHIAAGAAIVSGTLLAGAPFAAGTDILIGTLARLAAWLLTAMLGSFVLLVQVPAVLAELQSPARWTILLVETSVTGAAWIISAAMPAVRSPAAEPERQAA